MGFCSRNSAPPGYSIADGPLARPNGSRVPFHLALHHTSTLRRARLARPQTQHSPKQLCSLPYCWGLPVGGLSCAAVSARPPITACSSSMVKRLSLLASRDLNIRS